jgi:NodT family efflux transporter outer membrane factor (OMF) lipoprotein
MAPRPPLRRPPFTTRPFTRLRHSLLPLVLSLTLAGCTVGPEFHEPTLPKDATYISSSAVPPNFTSAGTVRGDQHLELGRDLPGQWWKLFRSPELTALVKTALKQNPDLKAAQAALNGATEILYANETNLIPTFAGQLQAQREQINGASLGLPNIRPTFSVITGSLTSSYDPDIWGDIRRQVQTFGAQVDYQRFELEAAYLSLTSKVVTTAINIAAIRSQISVTRDIISTESRELTIIHHQLLVGAASKIDVLQQKTSLAIARAKLPPLIKQLLLLQNELRALTGVYPNNTIYMDFSLKSLRLPHRLPISLPSSLIAQRPDIRATGALLRAACAKLGIAVANQLPQFAISASIGGTADGFTNLFSATTGVWSIMGGVSQTLFDAGALQDKKRAAADAVSQASDQYRSTVIAAFQNVSDALHAVQVDKSAFYAQANAEKSAAQTYSISRERFHDGDADYITLLTTDRTWQQTRLSLIKARAARLTDTVALFQALGGGWWNRHDMPATPHPSSALTLPIVSTFQP